MTTRIGVSESNLVKVVTTVTNNLCTGRKNDHDDVHGEYSLTGICVDLWQRTAKDLNLTYDLNIAKSWQEMLISLENGSADVFMERISDRTLTMANASNK